MSSKPKRRSPFQAAHDKGAAARAEGRPETDVSKDYPDKRGGKTGNVVTFSRAFRKRWLEGWREEDRRHERVRAVNQCDPCPTHEGQGRCGYRVGDPLPCTRKLFLREEA